MRLCQAAARSAEVVTAIKEGLLIEVIIGLFEQAIKAGRRSVVLSPAHARRLLLEIRRLQQIERNVSACEPAAAPGEGREEKSDELPALWRSR